MADHPTISAQVHFDIAAVMDDAVRAGEFATTEYIVRYALQLWLNEREMAKERLDAERRSEGKRLKRLWDEGLASGEPIDGNFDADDIIRRGRARLAARRAA